MRIWLCALVVVLLAGCTQGGGPAPEPAVSQPASVVTVLSPKAGTDLATLGVRRTSWRPRTAMLAGPGVTVAFDQAGTSSGLSADRLAAAGVGTPAITAPAGHELLLVRVHSVRRRTLPPAPADPAAASPSTAAATVAAVRVNGTPYPLDEGSVRGLAGRQVLVVAVPHGARVGLELTDHGRTQTLDLRTGRRGADALTGFYPLLVGSAAPRVDGRTDGGRVMVFRLTADAVLTPYSPARGWAAPGRTWLQLRLTFATLAAGLSFRADVAGSVRLSWPGGGGMTLDGASLADEFVTIDAAGKSPAAAVTTWAVVQVPKGLDGCTVRFRPRGVVRSGTERIGWAPTTVAEPEWIELAAEPV